MSPPAGAWTELGAGIRVRQSRAYRMNTVLLADPEHTAIVDPGVLPSELDELAAEVRALAPAGVTLVFTHGDWDHVLGRPWWPHAATLAHDRFAAEVEARRDAIRREAEACAASAGERWERGFQPFRPDQSVSGLRFLKLGPWRLVVRDAFGHSASMLSVHLPEAGVWIAADMLSDIEIPMIEHSVLAYRRTLEEILPLAEHGAIETLVPGHGSVAQGRDAVLERVDRDLSYLDTLAVGVAAALESGLPLEAAQERLAGMAYLGKDAEYAMNDVHRDNVAAFYREAAGKLPGARPPTNGTARA
jgi:glyoxylase-like metal-dependent hydrolase (beta-lactamase superfamily II)